jgi:hypothetical protein
MSTPSLPHVLEPIHNPKSLQEAIKKSGSGTWKPAIIEFYEKKDIRL